MVNPTRVLPRRAATVPAPITPAPVPQNEATTDPRRAALRQATFAEGEQMLTPLTSQRGALRGVADTVTDATTIANATRGNTTDTSGIGTVSAARGIVDRTRSAADALIPEEAASSASERAAGYLGGASGVLQVGTGAMRMRDAMNQADAARDPDAMLGAADTSLQATNELATGGQTIVNTANRVIDGGNRVAPTVGAARVLGGVGRVANGGRGVVDIARGVTQATRQGANEDEIQQGVVRSGRGALRAVGALAGPPGQVVAAVGDYAIEAAGDDRATRQRGWLGGQGGSEYATNQGMEVEAGLRDTLGARGARIAGMTTTAGASVIGAGANIAAHTADAGDRMANQAIGAMGMSGPGSLDIAADAEAQQRLQDETNGRHTAPRSDAAQERRVQAALARRRAARAAEERRRREQAEAEAARGNALPTTRAADVRPGQVDAAGRARVPNVPQNLTVNPETGVPFRSDAERNLYQMMHGGL